MSLIKPIKWHGGKHYLASRIVSLMPPHTRYLEAYAGGLSVLLQKPFENCSEYVNDLDGELTTFWQVLARPDLFDSFRRQVEAIPLSQPVFEVYRTLKGMCDSDDLDRAAVQKAVSFFVRNRQSRQGLGKDYCTPTKRLRRGMNENVSSWLTAVDGLPEIHARLRRVEVLCRPATHVIARLDDEDLLVYADPPYMHDTRSTTKEYGDLEMSYADHVELLNTLSGMKGKFILSGYQNDLYRHFADLGGWRRVDFDLPNNAASGKTKKRMTESIWMNFEPADVDEPTKEFRGEQAKTSVQS